MPNRERSLAPTPRTGHSSLVVGDLFQYVGATAPAWSRPLPPRLPSPEQLATLSDTELSELTALLVEELQRRATLDITAASSRLS
jgi:hypothetical protein